MLKYEYVHYNKGKCRGLQFSRARNAEEANRISRRERCERCWNNIKMFCQIIRDADKLDILYLFTIKDLTVDLDKEFSKEVYELLLKGENIDRKKLVNKTDRLALFLGYIFDINYLVSIKYLKDKKYLDIIIDIFIDKTDNKVLKKQLEEIRKVINNYIEVSLC